MAIPKRIVFISALTVISVTLYGISLLLPSIQFNSVEYPQTGSSFWKGYETLLLGWLGIFLLKPWWLCNIIYPVLPILGWTRLWRACGLLACVVSLLAVASLTIVGCVVPADEGDVGHNRIVSLGLSFYFWVASFAVWMITFVAYKKKAFLTEEQRAETAANPQT